ncbi:MAG: hypothetical protein K2Q06_05190 [Parvularculaceae bacterium]|nr:hypothetical protein [Parvularculaceae bacterium]
MRRLFPRSLSNAYPGSWAAVWLLVPVLVVKTVMGFNFSGLNPYVDVGEILKTVDGVPLDTFSVEAGAAVISSAHAWGAALFVICLAVWLVLIRYREGLPLAILALLVEQVIRTGSAPFHAVFKVMTGGTAPHAGALINFGMTALLMLSFLLSLTATRRRD